VACLPHRRKVLGFWVELTIMISSTQSSREIAGCTTRPYRSWIDVDIIRAPNGLSMFQRNLWGPETPQALSPARSARQDSRWMIYGSLCGVRHARWSVTRSQGHRHLHSGRSSRKSPPLWASDPSRGIGTCPPDQPDIGDGVMGGATWPGHDQGRPVARETSDAMDARGLDSLSQGHRREDGGKAPGQHRRARPRGPSKRRFGRGAEVHRLVTVTHRRGGRLRPQGEHKDAPSRAWLTRSHRDDQVRTPGPLPRAAIDAGPVTLSATPPVAPAGSARRGCRSGGRAVRPAPAARRGCAPAGRRGTAPRR
jgi:hypothetical protein